MAATDVESLVVLSELETPKWLGEDVKEPQDVMTDVMMHLRMFSFSKGSDFTKVVNRVLASLNAMKKKLKYLKFSHFLKNSTESLKFACGAEPIISLIGTSLNDKFAILHCSCISDATAYLQLLQLIYGYISIDTPNSTVLMNAEYMLGCIDVYKPLICDSIRAKLLFYISMIYERNNMLHKIRKHLRLCEDLNEDVTRVELKHLIMRNFMFYGDYRQAECFMSTYKMPSLKVPSLNARYDFYCGRLLLLSGSFEEAYNKLLSALETSSFSHAKGFNTEVHRHLLLAGLFIRKETNIKSLESSLKESLKPYYALSKAITFGRLDIFFEVLRIFKNVYISHNLFGVVQRLENMVVFHNIDVMLKSYSTFTIGDLAAKLDVSQTDATYILLKYLRTYISPNVKFFVETGNVVVDVNYKPESSKKIIDTFSRRIAKCTDRLHDIRQKMCFDSKTYYNKLAHDAADPIFIEEVDSIVEQQKKDGTEPGPGEGI